MLQSLCFFLLFLYWSIFQVQAQDCSDTRLVAVSRGERPSSASEPILYPDGLGGYWMVFKMRGFEDTWNRLFVQRVNSFGKPYFSEPGIAVSAFPGDQTQADAAPTASGLSLVWRQSAEPGLPADIFMQKISFAGELEFGKSGLPVCTDPGNQLNPKLWGSVHHIENYVCWEDEREGEIRPAIYIQKVHPESGLSWASNGMKVFSSAQTAKRPILCEDSKGGVFVIWEDYRSGTGWQLWFQSFTQQGHPRYAPDGNQVLRPDASSQSSASAVPDGFGGFFIVCEKMDVVNFESDIYFGRINHSGQLVYQYPACSAFGEQKNPKLATRTSEVILTWEDKRLGNWDIYGQYITLRDGRPQWEFNGISLASGEANQTHAGIFSTIEFNDILMTWAESENIFAQKVSSFGERLWDTSGVKVCTDFGRQEQPVICRNGEGGAWIAWTDHRAGLKVFYQHLNLNGQALQKDQGNTFIQDPEIHTGTGIENLNFLKTSTDSVWVIWEDYRKGPNDPDIYLSKMAPDGSSLFVENGLPVCTEVGEQTRPLMIEDNAGGVWVIWVDRRNNRDEDIYYQHFSSGGFPFFSITGRVLVSAPRSQAQVQVKPDGKGGFWAAWTDAREYKTQGFDVYVQHVLANGTIELEPGGQALSSGPQDSHTPLLSFGNEGEMGVVWLDNRNGYLNVWMQVLFSTGNRLFPGEGKAIAPTQYHQRQPALMALPEGWLLAWSEERFGQGRDKIYAVQLHSSGQYFNGAEGVRLSSGNGRQQRPTLHYSADNQALIAWQESSDKSDEGVLIRCREITIGKLTDFNDPGRLVARLSDEKDGISLNWHASWKRFLISWTEKKTWPAVAYTLEPDLRLAIPDSYRKACDSKFSQKMPKIFPGKDQTLNILWAEKRDNYEYILLRSLSKDK